MSDLVIRRATAADAPRLVELARQVSSEPEGWLLSSSDWRSAGDERHYLRAIRRSPHAAVYVAEVEGEIVARLSLARDPHPASSHVADLGLMVDASHRRLGIGRALLAQAAAWARELGVSKLELHVFPHNAPALALYESFGFTKEGYRRRHYRRDGDYLDAILMAYEVAPTLER
jgi:RimJ/RimL family protein N-acetyltransferase